MENHLRDRLNGFIEQFMSKGYARAIYGSQVNNGWKEIFSKRLTNLINAVREEFNAEPLTQEEPIEVYFAIGRYVLMDPLEHIIEFNFRYTSGFIRFLGISVKRGRIKSELQLSSISQIPILAKLFDAVNKGKVASNGLL